MQLIALAFVGTVVASAGAASDASGASRAAFARGVAGVTPVQKVIQMLNGMLTKGKEEKHAEQVQFAAYSQFCSDTEQEKTRAVQLADEEINLLKANIEMAQTTAEDLGREVQELDGQIATWQGDEKAAAKVREAERGEYLKAHQDYSETIDAITKATQVLKAQAYNRPQAEGLLQLASPAAFKKVPKATKRVLAAFLAAQEEPPAGPESEAYAYEFRSGSVVDMLEQLRDKFTDERAALEKEELNKRHAHELLVADLQRSVANAEESRSAKTQQKAKKLQAASQMQGELSDTTSTRTDDAKYLSDMKATCTQKAADYEERQKLRADELVALEKAIEILSSDKVKGSSEKYLAAMLQRHETGPSLLQLASAGQSPNQVRAAAYLNDRASQISSPVLASLAIHAREDPFAKVKKMIRDLINRLQDAAGEEAQHESWCRAELAENEAVRNSRSVSVERLMSEIDTKKSQVAKLASEITELSQQLTETEEATAEQTKIRNEEKKQNEQTIKDAQEAQMAVGQAVTVLKEFYAMAAQATAFVQRKHLQEPPPIFEGTYQGMGTENGGVISMLEVIQSDFARLESTTSAAEATAQQEYDRAMTESAVLKAQTQKDIEHKSSTKQSAEEALVDLGNDLTSAQKELAAAEAYFEKLKPSCIDSGMSFEERSQRRQEEIESLQEALRILNGEDITTA